MSQVDCFFGSTCSGGLLDLLDPRGFNQHNQPYPCMFCDFGYLGLPSQPTNVVVRMAVWVAIPIGTAPKAPRRTVGDSTVPDPGPRSLRWCSGCSWRLAADVANPPRVWSFSEWLSPWFSPWSSLHHGHPLDSTALWSLSFFRGLDLFGCGLR